MAIASKKKSPHHSNIKSILRLGKYREPIGGPTGAVTSCAADLKRRSEYGHQRQNHPQARGDGAKLLAVLSGRDEGMCVHDVVSEYVRTAVDEAHTDMNTQMLRILTKTLASGTWRPASSRSTSSRTADSTA